jgi:N-acetylmuramoyl-L-alanine amidase
MNARLLITLLAPAVLALVISCQSTAPTDPVTQNKSGRGAMARNARSLNLIVDLIPAGQFGRKGNRPMRPTFITVHSTQSYPPNANAKTHANALKNGYLTATNNLIGYLSWHYTVDQSSIYQSLPDNERGEHADYEGTGNKSSIGIEMCENKGNSREATTERTAKLVAALMKEHNIPISHVVPHYHWERIQPKTGKNIGHKECPHFLMDNGRPGPKWRAFQEKIMGYYRKA